MEYLSKPSTISIITNTVVKSSLGDRIPFKVLTLALTGISALLIKYVVQKEVTESIKKQIVAFFAGSQEEKHDLLKKEMKSFTEWKEKEKGTFNKWIKKEKAAFIELAEKEKTRYRNNMAFLESYDDFPPYMLREMLDPFKEGILKELKIEQEKTLAELKNKQIHIIKDLESLQMEMLP